MTAMEEWPEWLEGWLKLEDYGQVKCRRHVIHYNTLYCVTCGDKPICDECWKQSSLHKGDPHQTFKGVRCSRRVGVEVESIGKVMDVKKIQVYKINEKLIVYLNPNTASTSRAKYDPRCHTCKRKIMASQYMFCSIACMVKKNNGHGRNMAIESEKSSSSSGIGNDKLVGERLISANMVISSSSSSSFSSRKRSRKGIPRRAPLK